VALGGVAALLIPRRSHVTEPAEVLLPDLEPSAA
jgi:hypothetical protein